MKALLIKNRTFILFGLSSLCSAAADLLVFALLVELLRGALPGYVLASTVCARAVSLLINYLINKFKVFPSSGQVVVSMVRFLVLNAGKMLLSGLAVSLLYRWLAYGMGETAIKVVVDFLLFFLGYYLQKKWVFRQPQ
ncbi:MAG: GtrA family protein [Christensenellales bacterium]